VGRLQESFKPIDIHGYDHIDLKQYL